MKRKYIFLAFVLFLPQLVMAAPTATVNTNASSIEKGGSVIATVNLTDTAAWNIRISGSGAATCSTKQADVTSDGKNTTKAFSLQCNSTEEGTITFTVTGDITSESGETADISLTKDVTVTKPKSADNDLIDLKVDGSTVLDFSSSKTSYTLPDNLGTSISIDATAHDTKANISGTGIKTLNYGSNTFNIIVTAENGSTKTYTIIVNKPEPKSSNNYLKSLSVDKGTINFNKNTTNYTINVDNINEITINATAEDNKASVSGVGIKTLSNGNNTFNVIVTAENGSTKTYTIIVNKSNKKGSTNY